MFNVFFKYIKINLKIMLITNSLHQLQSISKVIIFLTFLFIYFWLCWVFVATRAGFL